MPKTLYPEALETAEELRAFYKVEIQQVRGIDRTARLRICLEDAHASELTFKGFLVGHPGVGKTTELSRLLLELHKFKRLEEGSPGGSGL